jgi:GTPase SAR1 family protein
VRNEFYKDTQGAIIVFDVSDRNSFEALDSWILELQNEIGNQSEEAISIFRNPETGYFNANKITS